MKSEGRRHGERLRAGSILAAGVLCVLPGCEFSPSNLSYPAPVHPPAPTFSLTIVPAEPSVTVAEEIRLELVVQDEDPPGQLLELGPIVWTVDDESIATITSPVEGCGNACALVLGVQVGHCNVVASTTVNDESVDVVSVLTVDP